MRSAADILFVSKKIKRLAPLLIALLTLHYTPTGAELPPEKELISIVLPPGQIGIQDVDIKISGILFNVVQDRKQVDYGPLHTLAQSCQKSVLRFPPNLKNLETPHCVLAEFVYEQLGGRTPYDIALFISSEQGDVARLIATLQAAQHILLNSLTKKSTHLELEPEQESSKLIILAPTE